MAFDFLGKYKTARGVIIIIVLMLTIMDAYVGLHGISSFPKWVQFAYIIMILLIPLFSSFTYNERILLKSEKLISFISKRDRGINISVKQYGRLIKLVELEASSFLERIKEKRDSFSPFFAKFYMEHGNIFLKLSEEKRVEMNADLLKVILDYDLDEEKATGKQILTGIKLLLEVRSVSVNDLSSMIPKMPRFFMKTFELIQNCLDLHLDTDEMVVIIDKPGIKFIHTKLPLPFELPFIFFKDGNEIAMKSDRMEIKVMTISPKILREVSEYFTHFYEIP